MTEETNEIQQKENAPAGFAKMAKPSNAMPDGLRVRIEKHAERTGDSVEEVTKHFLDSIRDDYGCENWEDEDEDLLIDWAEQCFVQLRRSTVSGGANTTCFVGCFIGVDANKRDRRANMVARAKREYTMDPNQAIGSGKVGVYQKKGDQWVIETSNGVIDTLEPVNEVPSMGFMADGDYICLLGSTTGRPMPSSMMGRHYFFLGNEESKFESNVQMWRVDCVGGAVDISVKVGEPCRIYVRPPNENAPEAYKDVLSVSMGFEDSIKYTNDFVSESDRGLLHPSKFMTHPVIHEHFVPLEDLAEVYEARSRTFEINGETGKSGPIVITKGTVNRLSTEPRDSEYDQTGRNFSLNLTSIGLQSMHGQGRGSEVTCWVSGACYDSTDPFVARKDDGHIEWAEKSTVLVVRRVGMSVIDGEKLPKLNVFGVYADPRRVRPRVGGGNTGREQFE